MVDSGLGIPEGMVYTFCLSLFFVGYCETVIVVLLVVVFFCVISSVK